MTQPTMLPQSRPGVIVAGLTPARYNVLRALVEQYEARKPVLPTVRELAANVGISPTAIHYALDTLEREGYVVRKRNTSRGTYPTDKALRVFDSSNSA